MYHLTRTFKNSTSLSFLLPDDKTEHDDKRKQQACSLIDTCGCSNVFHGADSVLPTQNPQQNSGPCAFIFCGRDVSIKEEPYEQAH